MMMMMLLPQRHSLVGVTAEEGAKEGESHDEGNAGRFH